MPGPPAFSMVPVYPGLGKDSHCCTCLNSLLRLLSTLDMLPIACSHLQTRWFCFQICVPQTPAGNTGNLSKHGLPLMLHFKALWLVLLVREASHVAGQTQVGATPPRRSGRGPAFPAHLRSAVTSMQVDTALHCSHNSQANS